MRTVVLGPLVRLVPVGLIVLGFQRKVAAPYRPLDVVVDVVLALVAAAGAGGGPERGALAGFFLGLMFDLATGGPLGLSSLAFGAGGMVAGYVVTITPDPPWWLAGAFTALGATVGEAAIPVVKLLTGVDGWVTPRLLVVLPVQAVAAFVLSVVFVPVGRWCMCVKRPKWNPIPE